MKRLILSVISIGIGMSLYASDIKPYGKFNFGDSIMPTIENICHTKDIETIIFNGHIKYKASEFCKSPIPEIKKVISKSYGMRRIDNKYFKNILKGGLTIGLEPINIKGIPFNLTVNMDLFGEQTIIGAYLANKQDTLMINKNGKEYLVPLSLRYLSLKPLEKDIFKIKREVIYNILKNKYSDLFAKYDKTVQRNFDRYKSLTLKDKKGARLKFDDGILYIYEDSILEEQFRQEYISYIKTLKTNLPSDSSGDL